jgi:cellulase
MSSSINNAILATLAAAASVSAHGFVTGVRVNGGAFQQGYDVTSFPYQSSPPAVIGWATFVAPDAFTTSDIACHRDGKNAQLSLSVSAGDTLGIQWNTWPESHHGPIIDMLASCGTASCASIDKTSLEFFKIAEKGLIDRSSAPAPGKWADDELLANNLIWDVKIPESLRPGSYVLRHEIIALHSAGQENGAQNYPQCINIDVSGSGNDLPAGVKATSLYTPTDAGILFNIYQPLSSYPIPGPPLASFGGGSGSAPVDLPASTVATQPTASVATSITTAVATPTSTLVVPPLDCGSRLVRRAARRALRQKARALA